MKRYLSSLIIAGLTTASLAGSVYGQANTGNQGASNGGANQTAPTTTAYPIQGAQFGQMGQTPWFMNNNVRSQLNLSDTQYQQMGTQYNQAYQEYQNSLSDLAKDMTPQARQNKANQYYNNFQQNFDTSLNSVYSDPAARQRYNQLSMQYQGYNAFRDPTTQARLNLNADQQRRFNEYQTDLNNRYNALQNQYYDDPVGFNTQYNQLMSQRQSRINNTLTPDQQQLYNNMVGQPYNFTPDFYFNATPRVGTNNVNGSVNSGVNAGAGAGGTGGGQ